MSFPLDVDYIIIFHQEKFCTARPEGFLMCGRFSVRGKNGIENQIGKAHINLEITRENAIADFPTIRYPLFS